MKRIIGIALALVLLLPTSVLSQTEDEGSGDYWQAQILMAQYFQAIDEIPPDDTDTFMKMSIIIEQTVEEWDSLDVTPCWAGSWYYFRILLTTFYDFLSYADEAKGAGAAEVWDMLIGLDTPRTTC